METEAIEIPTNFLSDKIAKSIRATYHGAICDICDHYIMGVSFFFLCVCVISFYTYK